MKNETKSKSDILKRFESVKDIFHLDCLVFRSDPERCLRCLCRGKIWTEEHRGESIQVYCGIYSINGGDFNE